MMTVNAPFGSPFRLTVATMTLPRRTAFSLWPLIVMLIVLKASYLGSWMWIWKVRELKHFLLFGSETSSLKFAMPILGTVGRRSRARRCFSRRDRRAERRVHAPVGGVRVGPVGGDRRLGGAGRAEAHLQVGGAIGRLEHTEGGGAARRVFKAAGLFEIPLVKAPVGAVGLGADAGPDLLPDGVRAFGERGRLHHGSDVRAVGQRGPDRRSRRR